MKDVKQLARDWIELKEVERIATENRRIVEDQLLEEYQLLEGYEGTTNINIDDEFSVKVVGRMNRKVDSDLLQELAREHGLTDHLTSLFRWKAELNKAVFEATSKDIVQPLLAAITTTPGRPSFSISIKE